MSSAAGTAMSAGTHPTLVEKAAAWSSWIFAGAVFLSVGWIAMAPDDPLNAVSLLTRRGSLLMLLQAGGLAMVTAALVTVVVGKRLPHAGTFAAGLGLAAASTRGGTTVQMLALGADGSPDFQSSLALRFAIEAVQWFVVMLAATATSAVVSQWCHGAASKRNASDDTTAGYRRPTNAWQHFGITVACGFVVFLVLSQGWSARSVQHGQACFVAAATIGIAAYLAYRVAPVGSPIPSLLGAGVLAVVGYLWASFRSAPVELPAIVPASPFLRVLPIQMVAVGIAAAVAMYWYVLPSLHETGQPSGDSPA
jgi:hypothetical protein